MTVTFGRIGRVLLLAAALLAAAAAVALIVLDGPVVPSVLGGVALIALVQGAVWTAVQHRLFGSVAAVRRTAATGTRRIATVVGVRGTSSAIGAEPVAQLDLLIDGTRVSRHVRVPFTHAAALRAGLELPVRTDPAGSRALVVEWDRLP